MPAAAEVRRLKKPLYFERRCVGDIANPARVRRILRLMIENGISSLRELLECYGTPAELRHLAIPPMEVTKLLLIQNGVKTMQEEAKRIDTRAKKKQPIKKIFLHLGHGAHVRAALGRARAGAPLAAAAGASVERNGLGEVSVRTARQLILTTQPKRCSPPLTT